VRARWPTIATAGALVGWYAADSLRHRREGGHGYELAGELDVRSERFLRAVEALTGAPVSYGNEADLLINGDEIFPAFLETIEGAQETLHVQTYVYWKGDIARDVAGAIAARARAGVSCKVLLDAVGAAPMDRDLIRGMERAGVSVVRFRPPKPYALKRIANRSHRRVLVADGVVGMTGGVGIAEEWTGRAQDPDHWRDTHVRVRGPVVRGLQGAFAESWLEATGCVLADEAHLPPLEPIDGGGAMQVMRSRAGVGDTNAEALYYLALASAQESIELTSAYFAPRPAFAKALIEAARRDVEVRVVVPGHNIDKPFVRVAGRASYDELLDGGVRIFEYEPTMLHAKSLCVDRAWSSVGSVNFDNRSFALNDEATLCVQSEAFAARLHDAFERDVAQSDEMRLDRFRDRGAGQRALEVAGRLARREL
jgi:cardiolipin synthase A/B